MITRLEPDTLRKTPQQYRGIYVHGTHIVSPQSLVCLSGLIGVAPDGTTQHVFLSQCHQAMDNFEALLAEAGMDMPDIMRVVYFVTDAAYLPELSALRQARWNLGHPPAVTTLIVAGLAAPDLLDEIEVPAAK